MLFFCNFKYVGETYTALEVIGQIDYNFFLPISVDAVIDIICIFD
jgi:hypothetical protein